jgi:hypothetical protein
MAGGGARDPTLPATQVRSAMRLPVILIMGAAGLPQDSGYWGSISQEVGRQTNHK